MCGLPEKFKAFAADWTIYSAVGTFTLYLAGYLSVRFHLTVLGVGTDLSLVEERYLFAGARFFVYLCFTIPTVVMLAFIPLGTCAVIYRCLPERARNKTRNFISRPNLLALTGIIVAVAMIQFVMRQCFFFANVLLSKELTGPAWLRFLFVTQSGVALPLYFAGLVAACGVTCTLLVGAWRREEPRPLSRFLCGLLGLLFGVELLLLPINHGILIADKTLARVADLGGKEQMAADQEAWLVWEGTNGVTFLLRNSHDARTLLTLKNEDVEKFRIVGYEPIRQILFEPKVSSQH